MICFFTRKLLKEEFINFDLVGYFSFLILILKMSSFPFLYSDNSIWITYFEIYGVLWGFVVVEFLVMFIILWICKEYIFTCGVEDISLRPSIFIMFLSSLSLLLIVVFIGIIYPLNFLGWQNELLLHTKGFLIFLFFLL